MLVLDISQPHVKYFFLTFCKKNLNLNYISCKQEIEQNGSYIFSSQSDRYHFPYGSRRCQRGN
jgi:hypothetical protein